MRSKRVVFIAAAILWITMSGMAFAEMACPAVNPATGKPYSPALHIYGSPTGAYAYCCYSANNCAVGCACGSVALGGLGPNCAFLANKVLIMTNSGVCCASVLCTAVGGVVASGELKGISAKSVNLSLEVHNTEGIVFCQSDGGSVVRGANPVFLNTLVGKRNSVPVDDGKLDFGAHAKADSEELSQFVTQCPNNHWTVIDFVPTTFHGVFSVLDAEGNVLQQISQACNLREPSSLAWDPGAHAPEKRLFVCAEATSSLAAGKKRGKLGKVVYSLPEHALANTVPAARGWTLGSDLTTP